MRYSSYIICGTPRSGSTLLCTLLTQTGIAGRPLSYFREKDIGSFAARWGIGPEGSGKPAAFNAAFLAAVLREGSAGTGMFGLRLMWPSLATTVERLSSVQGKGLDPVARLAQAFGPTLFIHLSRSDKVAQAISLFKAEQTGLWHLSADGSVLEGLNNHRPVNFDADRIGALLTKLEADDLAWTEFLNVSRIKPFFLTYETLTGDPRAALSEVLGRLGLDARAAKTVTIATAKMADVTSQQWADRFRKERGVTGGCRGRCGSPG